MTFWDKFQYDQDDEIGFGGYGRVYKTIHKGIEFALKIFNPHSNSENIDKEIEIHKSLNHPNIVRCYTSITMNKRKALVLELCDQSLASYISSKAKTKDNVPEH